MKKNRELELLCEEILKFQISLERIATSEEGNSTLHGNDRSVSGYMGRWGEIHLDLVLEEIAKNNRNWKIDLDPIADGEMSKDYFFRRKPQKTVEAFQRDPIQKSMISRPVAEYDNVIMINGLPTAFEVKTGSWKKPGQKKSISICLGRERIGSKLRPIEDLYGREAGYVMMIPRDIYFGVRNNSIKRSFEKEGRILLPLPMTQGKYKHAVAKKLIKHNFPYRIWKQSDVYFRCRRGNKK